MADSICHARASGHPVIERSKCSDVGDDCHASDVLGPTEGRTCAGDDGIERIAE